MALEISHYNDCRKHGDSCDMCHYHPFHQSFISFSNSLCHRNWELRNIHHDDRQCPLSVGMLFFMMAFCKVLTVPVCKGKAVQPNLKRHVYIICLGSHTIFSRHCFRHRVSTGLPPGYLARARHKRSSFLSHPIRYDKAWIHILENMAKMFYVILYSCQQG